MSTAIRAVAKVAPRAGALALIDRPEPEPGPGEVRVRVAAAGICGTDLEIYRWPDWMNELMADGLPVVIGHEFAGVVDRIGAGVDRGLEGARVAAESHAACGQCSLCRRGSGHLCERTRYLGFHFDGGFAESVVIPETIARRVPDGVDDLSAALLEPFGIAVRAVDHRAGVADRHVLITGCGPLGVMAALVARARGAATIVLSESDAGRRAVVAEVAASACPDALVGGDPEELAAVVSELTDGHGVDVWIDFAGVQATADAGMNALVKGGEGRLLGLGAERVSLDLATGVARELCLQFLHGRLLGETWTSALALLGTGEVSLSEVVTAQMPLSDFEQAFTAVREHHGLKVVLRP